MFDLINEPSIEYWHEYDDMSETSFSDSSMDYDYPAYMYSPDSCNPDYEDDCPNSKADDLISEAKTGEFLYFNKETGNWHELEIPFEWYSKVYLVGRVVRILKVLSCKKYPTVPSKYAMVRVRSGQNSKF